MKRFEDNFQKDQQKNAEKTRARLAARRKKKQEQEVARIHGDIQGQADVDERRTQDHMNLIQQKGERGQEGRKGCSRDGKDMTGCD